MNKYLLDVLEDILRFSWHPLLWTTQTRPLIKRQDRAGGSVKDNDGRQQQQRWRQGNQKPLRFQLRGPIEIGSYLMFQNTIELFLVVITQRDFLLLIAQVQFL